MSISSNSPKSTGDRRRLASVDVLRGAAIVLMALDHVREFLQREQFDPLDLAQTSAVLFLTRWVTHFCAPVFVFLAGTGAALALQAGRSRNEMARFLFVRGLWLVVLELTVVRFGWYFNLNYASSVAQVIWAIGWSMVLLAPAIYLPATVVGAIGVGLVAFHNLLAGLAAASLSRWSDLWHVALSPGPITLAGLRLYVAYPVLPWAGVMFASFGARELYRRPPANRRLALVCLGTVLTLLFIGLRALNRFGDPEPWSPQPTALGSLLSFLNCEKYPPSLLFVLMTLGPALVLLGVCDRPPGRVGRFLIVFGRVPLFFYLVHIPVTHLLALLITYAQQRTLPAWLFSFPPGHAGPGGGVPLPAVFLIWVAVVALHYPLCVWFWHLKRDRRAGWMRYV